MEGMVELIGVLFTMCICSQPCLVQFRFSSSGMGRFRFKVVRLPKKTYNTKGQDPFVYYNTALPHIR